MSFQPREEASSYMKFCFWVMQALITADHPALHRNKCGVGTSKSAVKLKLLVVFLCFLKWNGICMVSTG